MQEKGEKSLVSCAEKSTLHRGENAKEGRTTFFPKKERKSSNFYLYKEEKEKYFFFLQRKGEGKSSKRTPSSLPSGMEEGSSSLHK